VPSRPLIADDTKFTLAPSAISTSMPGETVILDANGDQYFSLEGIGPRIWQLLEAPATVASIVATIRDEYEVEAGTCERDVVEMLGELIERGLIVSTS